MQIGFNNDVEHGGTVYHIQTEDLGLSDKKITSQIFTQGAIVDSMTISYSKQIEELSDDDARDEQIRKRMRALHKHCFKMIKGDKYEAKPAAETPPPAAQEAPAEAKPERPSLPPLQLKAADSATEREAPDEAADTADAEQEVEYDDAPTMVMEGLPHGISVAGIQSELGERTVAEKSRGVVMAKEELGTPEEAPAPKPERKSVPPTFQPPATTPPMPPAPMSARTTGPANAPTGSFARRGGQPAQPAAGQQSGARPSLTPKPRNSQPITLPPLISPRASGSFSVPNGRPSASLTPPAIALGQSTAGGIKYSDARAFRGLDVPDDHSLIALLEAL